MMNDFNKNIINIYGPTGQEWLANLPTLIAKFAHKYQLSHLQPVDNMSFNYVAVGYQNEKPIILKLGLNKIALAMVICIMKIY